MDQFVVDIQHNAIFLFRPFVACLVVIFIHGYLGIHVIARKVIFVDIALAQIAAVGAIVAVLQGFGAGTNATLLFSMGFATLAAAIFAITRTEHERVPQEAVIGLSYAIAAAAAIVIADKLPHGAEHLKELVAGNVLFASWTQIWHAAVMYAAVGLFHVVFGRRFLLISEHPEEAYRLGMRVRVWEFLFYLTFSMVVTHSIQIVGVLMVFCYLVAPAVFAVLFAERFWSRLILGWSVSIATSIAGLVIGFDSPTGPAIMCGFAVTLIVGALLRAIVRSSHPVRTTALTLAAATGLYGAGWTVVTYAKPDGDEHRAEHEDRKHDHPPPEHGSGSTPKAIRASLKDMHEGVRIKAAEDAGKLGDTSLVSDLARALFDNNDGVREKAAEAIEKLNGIHVVPDLVRALNEKQEDEWVRYHMARALVHLGSQEGIPVLLELAKDGEAHRVREEALKTLLVTAGRDDERVLGELTEWWTKNRDRLVWDPKKKMFVPKP